MDGVGSTGDKTVEGGSFLPDRSRIFREKITLEKQD